MAGDLKRRRTAAASTADSLGQLLHIGGVSTSGLAKILDRLQHMDLANVSDWQLRQANFTVFNKLAHTIKMDANGGGAFDWELLHPNKLLAEMVSENDAFRHHMSEAFRRRPPSVDCPWRLIIGFDEFTPGIGKRIASSIRLSELRAKAVQPSRS